MKTIMKKIKSKFLSKLAERETRKVFLADANFTSKYSLANGSHKDNHLGRIMLLMHALEKGMTFSNGRIFGEDKANALCRELEYFFALYGINETCIVALNVLNEYLSHQNSTKNEKVRKDVLRLLEKYSSVIEEGLAGTKNVFEPPVFDEKIEEFFASRSSVREYSDEEVTEKEIESALHIASYTPSACNRQASRVHVYRKPKIMERIITNQLGNQNWCQNAKVLFVVSVNECYFGEVMSTCKASLMEACMQ